MNSLLALGMPGGWEWIIIILVVLIFFGAKKIPELARGLGKGIREFRREVSTGDEGEDGAESEASPENTVSATKCPSCGSLNEVSARHCNQCGTALGSAVEQN